MFMFYALELREKQLLHPYGVTWIVGFWSFFVVVAFRFFIFSEVQTHLYMYARVPIIHRLEALQYKIRIVSYLFHSLSCLSPDYFEFWTEPYKYIINKFWVHSLSLSPSCSCCFT